MPDHIPSEELTLDLVPDPDTATDDELWEFAHTFHAYEHWGGLEEAFTAIDRAAEFQKEAVAEYEREHGDTPEWYPYPEPQLDYLRTDMFLDCRATRHCNQDGPPSDVFWEGIREYVKAVRHLLGEDR